MGKDKSTTSTTAVDPTTAARQAQLWTSANKLPSSFVPYTGELVAPTTDQQNLGFGQTAGASQIAQPGYARAAGIAGDVGNYQPQTINSSGYTPSMVGDTGAANATAISGATNFTPQDINPNQFQGGSASPGVATSQSFPDADINKYLNPYISNVVDTTNADTERQRQIQIASGQAQATAAGAYGGSRHGVADSLTNEAALRTEAQNAAQLRSAGYTQAAGQIAGDQNRAAGVSTANAGNATGASIATLGAGTAAGAQRLGALTNNANLGLGAADLRLRGAQSDQSAGLTASLANLANRTTLGTYNAGAANAAGAFRAGAANTASAGNANLGLAGANTRLGAAQTLGGLSAGAQTSALQGAGANIAAGGVQQNTNQNIDTAAHNQFTQAQQFPYQYQQFLQGFTGTPGYTQTKTQKGNLFGDILGAAGSIGGALFKKSPVGAAVSAGAGLLGGGVSGGGGTDDGTDDNQLPPWMR